LCCRGASSRTLPSAPYVLTRNSLSIQSTSRLENPLSTKRPCGCPVRHNRGKIVQPKSSIGSTIHTHSQSQPPAPAFKALNRESCRNHRAICVIGRHAPQSSAFQVVAQVVLLLAEIRRSSEVALASTPYNTCMTTGVASARGRCGLG
jgi:hypothetical protein